MQAVILATNCDSGSHEWEDSTKLVFRLSQVNSSKARPRIDNSLVAEKEAYATGVREFGGRTGFKIHVFLHLSGMDSVQDEGKEGHGCAASSHCTPYHSRTYPTGALRGRRSCVGRCAWASGAC